MIFLLVLAIATTAALLALRGRGRRTAARWGLGIAMVVAGLAHLANPTPFEQHLPDWVPGPSVIVAATGIMEIALGIGLALVRSRRRLVGLATAAYLAAVFPANVYVAVAGIDVDGQPGGVYPWLRLPFQALFIAWALWSTAEPSGPTEELLLDEHPGDSEPLRAGGSAGSHGVGIFGERRPDRRAG